MAALIELAPRVALVLAQALNALAKVSFAWPPRAGSVSISGVATGVAAVLTLAEATVGTQTIAKADCDLIEVADADTTLIDAARGTTKLN